MRIQRGPGLLGDLSWLPPQTTMVVISIAPVIVGTGVTAHYRLVPAGRGVAALGVVLSLGFGLWGLLRTSGSGGGVGVGWARLRAAREILPATLAGLAVALVLGAWLAANSAWWLLAVGVAAVAITAHLARPPGPNRPIAGGQLALVAAAELLAGWGTVWVELGRLPWLGLVAAILPASLATALLILAQLRDRSAEPAETELGAVAGLSVKGARTLLQGLLVLALAVPLLITVPGLDGAECFLPWLLAPLGEGPLRNSRSAEAALRQRAVRQTAGLLLACSALLAVGIWTG